MKKKISFIILLIGIFLLSGCTTDSMENITIYTSIYPIEYVTNELYGNYSTIYNMYPQGINPFEYKLTDKQIKDYGNSDLVIYNGLGKEKDYIVTMVNNNRKLKIIDSTNRIEYKYSQNEVWINPSNVLMVTRNVKEGLKEYVISENLDKKIDDNYEALKINISNLDVELKEMAENASNKDMIVQDNELTSLSKYGLNIISLDSETVTDKIYNDAKNMASSGEIKYIFVLSGYEENEYTKRLKEEYTDLEIMYIDPINNISTEDKNAGKDYISIMNDNIDKLKQELY